MNPRAVNCLLPAEAPASPRPYDFEMIRDFFNQLLWDLRIDHNAWAAPAREAAGASLDPPLAPAADRQTTVVLPSIRFENAEHLSPNERHQVRARMAALRQTQIEALEILMQGPISEILRGAGSDASVAPALVLDAMSFLDRHVPRETEGS